MITLLVEAHYARHLDVTDERVIRFWLRELRSPAILIDVARSATTVCESLLHARPLLQHAVAGSEELLKAALHVEEDAEREADRHYWAPLKSEHEQLRRKHRQLRE